MVLLLLTQVGEGVELVLAGLLESGEKLTLPAVHCLLDLSDELSVLATQCFTPCPLIDDLLSE